MVNYYKLINGENFVGIATSLDLRRYQHKHRIILLTDESNAQYIQCNDKYYHARWMLPINTNNIEYDIVDIIQIEKDEYDALFEAVEAGKDVVIEPEPEPVEELPDEPQNNVTVDYIKTMKLVEMSNKCNQTITSGFDILLSDNKVYHFSLTTQDQLNLITLSSMLSNGETSIPYHADGELCRFYSAEDIAAIIEMATKFKTYQVSYYNSLKVYIESLSTIDEIRAVVYGTEIPVEYQSDVLKILNSQLSRGTQ